ncbi:hypothetical protein KFL_004440050 [Klebsormidium nitens]|uniref:Fe2OG dioxygenase domain-containing protein n=1 Tax=Klebsormidium nitens TaxID=105231 RepID=A0A1Y1IIX3_KLENI|nr:hypothetical protein KFL_004440050 [Klebsormidium nitens]|eukprot:GAQ88607.1 hypothetical protein KFL_004440050 [Klebsormidium nitens]
MEPCSFSEAINQHFLLDESSREQSWYLDKEVIRGWNLQTFKAESDFVYSHSAGGVRYFRYKEGREDYVGLRDVLERGTEDCLVIPLGKLDVETVPKYCSPSPYGDLLNESTQVDTGVRRALEARFKARKEEEDENQSSFVERVRNRKPCFEALIRIAVAAKLCFNQAIKLVPYKLNINGPGDFFRPHVDTPVDPELFIGTVVVCLPSPFTGGELIVTHVDASHTFDFATKSNDKAVFQFAAFYGDCLHEIKPVTSGHRITLTYHIMRKRPNVTFENDDSEFSPEEVFPVEADDICQEQICNQFQAELRILSSLGLPYVGFLLQHGYTQAGISEKGLKGSDRLFYELLTAAGWKCHFVPVLVVRRWNRGTRFSSESDFKCTLEVLSFTNDDYDFLRGSLEPETLDGLPLMEPCEFVESIDGYLNMEEALKSGKKRRLSPAEQWEITESEDGKGRTLRMKEDWREYVTFKDVLKQVREGRTYHGETLE